MSHHHVLSRTSKCFISFYFKKRYELVCVYYIWFCRKFDKTKELKFTTHHMPLFGFSELAMLPRSMHEYHVGQMRKKVFEMVIMLWNKPTIIIIMLEIIV